MTDDEPLDEIDLKILSELQKDGRIRNNELAERVGISPPPCQRRMKSLRRRGFIRAIRATLDERRLGYEVTSFVLIQLKSQARTAVQAFEASIAALPHVQQCSQISGDADFMLKCLAPNVEAMHRQLLQFAAMPEVQTIRTYPVLGLSKDAPLPLPEAPHPRPAD
ncbi:Lrp/AsnC family transcriptional regulator [Bradyrhizobium sp.]|uniref:Lrp/AsnC family transcriptional regulator n=1 Tax=Bradyrhizobium sp. TaxID=376 RepID=UPI001D840A05|nr:Lrp/AsnC family transcriptional regulator [Bradyrhizobium sp.]MBI5319500.1 Lrp/AsnC family transcriptional regulator [Bradyrhizobium sp.]